MPRPRKWRNVCCIPERTVFGPLGPGKGDSEIVLMTLDEYETIRLIDFEGMTQEECSESMGVARTTIQRIYNGARNKLAEILVNGNIVKIEGGDIHFYGESGQGFGMCRRHWNGQDNVPSNK
ncbi:MAG: DUF134 domain-containing protein [Clostridiales bacterium]|nr:DUF134 domain-containing protein [Clostridiales bacterium]